jgi:hypothetical protein
LIESLLVKFENIFNEQQQKGTEILDMFDQEKLLETIFLVFTVLSDFVESDPKLLRIIKTTFDKYFDKICQINSNLINHRVCLFFGKYIKIFYNENKEKMSICLNRLLNFIFMEHQGLNYQVIFRLIKAVQTLNLLVKDKENKQILNLLITNFLDKMITLIPRVTNKQYFDLILELTKHFEIENFVLPLVKEITVRILKEAKIYERKNKEKVENVIIIKCFNILTSISEKEKYVITYLVSYNINLEFN